MPKKKDNTFEQDLKRLEEIAAAMEDTSVPLEELCRLYEEGMKLSDGLSKRLENAYSVMKIVTPEEDGSLKEEEFPIPEAVQDDD